MQAVIDLTGDVPVIDLTADSDDENVLDHPALARASIPTSAIWNYETFPTEGLARSCQPQGINYAGINKAKMLESLLETRGQVDAALRKDLAEVVCLSIDNGCDSAAWSLLLLPPPRLPFGETFPITVLASGVYDFDADNRKSKAALAQQVYSMITHAWSQLPNHILKTYNCESFAIMAFAAKREILGLDSISCSINPLKISRLFLLEATDAQKEHLSARSNAQSRAAAICLLKKQNTLERIAEFRTSGFLIGGAIENFEIHDICDSILLGVGWFRWIRATLDQAGNPL
ncbi:hypothetical protein BDR26DRAFT_1008302 [Obelidium mucronatum]|nr:hypothetical protein BDR26DRAFT_1008302 [Obelidium mucronatum]